MRHQTSDSDQQQISVKPVYVPDALLSRLQWKKAGKYTAFRKIFWCISVDTEQWVGVVGDGDNAEYEYFIFSACLNRLELSEVGYGSPHTALRDVLNRVDPAENGQA